VQRYSSRRTIPNVRSIQNPWHKHDNEQQCWQPVKCNQTTETTSVCATHNQRKTLTYELIGGLLWKSKDVINAVRIDHFTHGHLPPSNIGAIPPNQGNSTRGPGDRSPNVPPHGPKTKFLLSIIGNLRWKLCCFTPKLFSKLNFHFKKYSPKLVMVLQLVDRDRRPPWFHFVSFLGFCRSHADLNSGPSCQLRPCTFRPRRSTC